MKFQATFLLATIFTAAPLVSGASETQTANEYAQLSIKGLIGASRASDDFRWTFPEGAGKMTSVFKTSRDEMAKHFGISAKSSEVVPAIVNEISGVGWRLVDVHRVESYEENGILTPFYTYYHFVRQQKPNKAEMATPRKPSD